MGSFWQSTGWRGAAGALPSWSSCRPWRSPSRRPRPASARGQPRGRVSGCCNCATASHGARTVLINAGSTPCRRGRRTLERTVSRSFRQARCVQGGHRSSRALPLCHQCAEGTVPHPASVLQYADPQPPMQTVASSSPQALHGAVATGTAAAPPIQLLRAASMAAGSCTWPAALRSGNPANERLLQ